MRQMINISVGQCGNRIGNSFWETISEEHGINNKGKYEGDSDLQLQRIDVFYNQTSKGNYLSRSILVDLQPGTIDYIKAGNISHIYNQSNFIVGNHGSSNNWAIGHYTYGNQYVDQVGDSVRREIELCDKFFGFQMMHSLGGGTGSGMGTLILSKLKQQYPDRIMNNIVIYPSEKVSDTIVEPYNTCLALNHLVTNSDLCMNIDNEALYNICSKTQKYKKINYSCINATICKMITGLSCPMRFPGQLNTNLLKMSVHLVPFPRLHFFLVGFCPLEFTNHKYNNIQYSEAIQKLAFNSSKNHLMLSINPKDGKYFTGSFLFRGNMSTSQAQELVVNIRKNNPENFKQWIPDNFQATMCNVAPKGLQKAVTFIGNTTAVQYLNKRISEQFTNLFRRKAFLHWYINQGMDQMQFTEAQSNLNDLISQYQQWGTSADDLQQWQEDFIQQ